MTQFDIDRSDARGKAAAIRRGEVSSLELVEHAIDLIGRHNPRLNALSWECFEQAREEAAVGGRNSSAPFAGVPILLKDHRALGAGEETRFGTTALAVERSPWQETSHVRRAIQDAGFVVLGRTTTPEFATALVTESVATGVTRNPVSFDHTPGGSSGGAAAAVGSGMVDVAHATDGGGSIRAPASMCGLVGFKASRGRVSLGPDGESWAGATVEGVITRTVGDAAAATAALSRLYAGSPYAAPGRVPAEPRTLDRPLTIGVLATHPMGDRWPSGEVRGVLDEVAGILSDRGHDVGAGCPNALRDEDATTLYDLIVDVDVQLLARRIEIQLGRSLTTDDLAPRNLAKIASARSLKAVDYLDARYRLGHWSGRLQEWWEGAEDGRSYDLLMTPTIGNLPALAGDDPHDDASIVQRSQEMAPMTSFANIAGLPAISLPLGRARGGLPIGIQFVARYGAEELLLELAWDFELRGPWNVTRPEGWGLATPAGMGYARPADAGRAGHDDV